MKKIFDTAAMRRQRHRAAPRLGTLATILDELARRLLDRLDDTTASFHTALEIGGRGSAAPVLAGRGMWVVSADFCPGMAQLAGGLPVAIDGEALPFRPASFDLIVAPLSLHWINDLPGALLQLRQALKPGGLFLASLPVLGTLAELRAALLEAETSLTGGVSPRISPYPDLRDCAGLLQRAGFALPVADVEDVEFLYADPLALLHELRDAGEGNAIAERSRKFPPRELFARALANLPRRDGRAVASFRMAIMTGWNP